MRDPYQILGVAKDASHADVKKAFRKLAKQHHPDQHPNDPKAKDRFSEANAAYEILGDEKKRAQFDRGEIDAEGKPRHPGFEGFAGGGAGPERAASGARLAVRRPSISISISAAAAAGFDAADIFSDLFRRSARRPARRRGGRCANQGADIALETADFAGNRDPWRQGARADAERQDA